MLTYLFRWWKFEPSSPGDDLGAGICLEALRLVPVLIPPVVVRIRDAILVFNVL
jgi:hypothetical protein